MTAALAAGILLTLPGCGGQQDFVSKASAELTAGLEPVRQGEPLTLTEEQGAALTDFGLKLLRSCAEAGENTLISPMSVLTALGMTVNGAAGETLTEMEAVLGMERNALNQALSAYWSGLPDSESALLRPANSLWVTDQERFTVEPDFLQTCTDYYNAEVFQTPMDTGTCRDINRWVSDHTEGMIPEILDQVPPEAVMYLVNALAFDGKWREPYRPYQVYERVFLTDTGDPVDAELMYSEEGFYLENEVATGVVKPYEGGDYAFVGLLPREGRSLSELLAALDGESLQALLRDQKAITVNTLIPKYETETSLELREALAGLGMPLAFDENRADFSRLGFSEAGNIYISRVLHKTVLSLAEEGTKAAAATVVEAADGCAALPEEFREVFLDQPFVYLLIDTETCVPFFIGTMTDPTGAAPAVPADTPPMEVQVEGKLYRSTGRHSELDGRCGVMDGEIDSTVDRSKSPKKDDQSNFGTGWGYQFMPEDTIEVNLGRHWIVFEQVK